MSLRIEEILSAMAFVGTRVSGLLVFAPVLGSSALAPRVKAAFVVMVTAALYPVSGPRGLSLTIGGMLRLMASEFLLGVLLGLVVQFVFEAAQFAGQLIGMQVGLSLVNLLDPTTQVETPVISTLHQTVATLIFLELNVHHWLLRAVRNSFLHVPPGTAWSSAPQLLHSASGIWVSGLQLAAPALLATIFMDLVMGFLGKASPQLPVLFVGISAKAMVGMILLALSLKYWPSILEANFARAIGLAEQFLSLAH